MGGWMDGWTDGRAGLRIAYSNQKAKNGKILKIQVSICIKYQASLI